MQLKEQKADLNNIVEAGDLEQDSKVPIIDSSAQVSHVQNPQVVKEQAEHQDLAIDDPERTKVPPKEDDKQEAIDEPNKASVE